MTYNSTWTGVGARWQPAGDYRLDWDVTGADGTAALDAASGADPIGVSVSTPTNDTNDAFDLCDGLLFSNDVTDPTISEIVFNQPVTDVNFQLIDVDAGRTWDDQVTVLAYDRDGNLVDVDFVPIDRAQTVSGSTVEGDTRLNDVGITVSVAGPIVKLVIVHDNGPDAVLSGHVKVSDIGFNAMPAPEGDGIVEGTDSNDVIDLAFTGDPQGDRIDAGDALLPGESDDDDIIRAGTGDDWVWAGAGDDDVRAGAGDDTVLGGAGDDVIYGGDGDDRIEGGAGADTLAGGDDRDWFGGVGAGDSVDGNEGGHDCDTLDLTGSAAPGGSLNVTYTTEDRETGYVTYKDADGTYTGTLEFNNIELVVPCFTPGTMIATAKGEVPVETLTPGDRVITRDNGIQEIMWVGARTLDFSDLARGQHLAPIHIQAGALGDGLPERDMLLSPNHRVLVTNDRTSLYFDEREVLAAAKHLVNSKGVRVVEPLGVSYLHFMCRNHEVVLSNGAWTESFQPGAHVLKGIGNAQRQELFELFPELETREGLEEYGAARRILKPHEAQVLFHT